MPTTRVPSKPPTFIEVVTGTIVVDGASSAAQALASITQFPDTAAVQVAPQTLAAIKANAALKQAIQALGADPQIIYTIEAARDVGNNRWEIPFTSSIGRAPGTET